MQLEDKMLSHVDLKNNPKMVNIIRKDATLRTAVASCKVLLPSEFVDAVVDNEIITKKGAVFSTAIVAGTLAAKKTHELIPFCHLLPLEGCKINISYSGKLEILITCSVELFGKTGVEMEALVGVNVAALTIFDMCKSISHKIRIDDICLVEKRGGKSDFS